MIATIDESQLRELMGSVQYLMSSDVATRAVRRCVVAALKPIGKAHKAVIPKGPTGRLKRGAGKVVFSRGTGRAKSQQIARAVVGLNTGQKRGSASHAPHAAMWSLGTFPRWTGMGRGKDSRGRRIPGGGRLGKPKGGKIAFRGFTHPALKIRPATASALPAAMAALENSLKGDLPFIVKAARRRK